MFINIAYEVFLLKTIWEKGMCDMDRNHCCFEDECDNGRNCKIKKILAKRNIGGINIIIENCEVHIHLPSDSDENISVQMTTKDETD
ncbi:MAG: hypothetical protein LBU68_01140 [Rickettsiales bacterium]|nr:hypothetical protein [Rickettsiales bacterium]